MGRPTLYQPEFCDDVIALGKEGKSLAQMCAHFDIARSTIDAWAEANAEFSEALNRAKTHCQAWWEEKGMSGMEKPGFNAAVWKKSMEARFRDDYTERKEVNGSLAAVILTSADADL
jgi:hypothetical protein